MRYLVQTFGCQMNVHDSRRIEEVLGERGWSATDEVALADLVIFNTCSVREKAEQKLLSVLGTFRALKEERPSMVLAVAGCVAQQEGEKLLARVPYIDVVLGPDNIPELPGIIAHVQDGGPPVARTVFDLDDPRFLRATPSGAFSREGARREVTGFVTTMKGCDERCTFCIVPTTRGPERYRPADDVIGEIAGMVAGGVREVTLLGQTVNSWNDGAEVDERAPSRFAWLLRRIAAEVPDLARLRYTSPHPRHLTDDLIAAHAELEVLPAHVHLPVQSGSNRMLKRMLRRYTRESYLERTALLRAARAGLTLSTDLIVGFPGETDEDFQETLSLVREAHFVAAFAFKYSPRPHTPALKLGDDVPDSVKDARLHALLAQVAEQQSAHLQSLVGTQTRVLVEGIAKIDESDERTLRWKGRSDRHEIVHVDLPADRDATGALVSVEITRANAHSLQGEVRMDPSALPLRQAAPPPAEPARVRLPVMSRARERREASR